MQRLLLLLLVVLTATTAGCFEQDAPPAFNAQRKGVAGDSEAASVPSCAVEPAAVPTDYEELRNLLEGGFNNESDGLTGELARAMKWNDAADKRAKDLLGRFAPALTEEQQKQLADAYEEVGLASYDGNEKPVSEVRATYRDKIGPLAAALAGIDASAEARATLARRNPGGGPDHARMAFHLGYQLMAMTPCPAGALKFAGQLLSARDPANPYAAMYADYIDDQLARDILQLGLAQAIVERVAVHQDPAKGLADIHGWLSVAAPYVKDLDDDWGAFPNLLQVLSSPQALLDFATTGEPQVKFRHEGDETVARQLQMAAGFVAFATDDGGLTVLQLMQKGGQGWSALNLGMEKAAKYFGWARLSSAAAKLKVGATWFNRAVTVVMRVPEIADSIHTLIADPDANDWATGFDLAGHVLMLAGAFLPMPWGIAVGFAGKVALMIAKQLREPSDDDVIPVLKKVGFDDVQSYALKMALPDKLETLRSDLGIEPADVVWLQTRTVNLGAYDVQALAQIAKITGSQGQGIMNWLKAIPRPETPQWEGFAIENVLRTINAYWIGMSTINGDLCNPLRSAAGAAGTLSPTHYAAYFMPPYADGSAVKLKGSALTQYGDTQMKPRARTAHLNAAASMPGGCP